MVSRAKLTPEAYQRQIAGLKYPASKGREAKNHNVAVKVDIATKTRLKEIDNWPDKLRDAIAKLIEEANQENNTNAAA